MWRRFSLTFKLTVLVVIAIGVAIINGCGKLSPVSPESEQTTQIQPYNSQQSIENQWGKILSSQDGGTLRGSPTAMASEDTLHFTPLGYNTRFIIPLDATPDPSAISCQVNTYYTAGGMVYIYNFEPSGLEFDTPTKIELDMAALEDYNPNPDPFIGAELRYYNPVNGVWELQSIDTDIQDGKVSFNIDHFSRYGIGGRDQ